MARIDDYLWLLQSLLPEGPIWPRDPGSDLSKLLRGKAAEYAAIHDRALNLISEIDPRTTLELLPRWEAIAGLPDPCAGEAQTLEGRRNRLTGTITARGGASPAYFIGLAAALGYEIQIEEFQPFTCDSECDTPLWSEDSVFVWKVHAPSTSYEDWTCDSPCDEPLWWWSNAPLECAIRRRKPAHTEVIFSYADPPNDFGYIGAPVGLVMDWGSVADPPDAYRDHGGIE